MALWHEIILLSNSTQLLTSGAGAVNTNEGMPNANNNCRKESCFISCIIQKHPYHPITLCYIVIRYNNTVGGSLLSENNKD